MNDRPDPPLIGVSAPTPEAMAPDELARALRGSPLVRRQLVEQVEMDVLLRAGTGQLAAPPDLGDRLGRAIRRRRIRVVAQWTLTLAAVVALALAGWHAARRPPADATARASKLPQKVQAADLPTVNRILAITIIREGRLVTFGRGKAVGTVFIRDDCRVAVDGMECTAADLDAGQRVLLPADPPGPLEADDSLPVIHRLIVQSD